MKLSTVIGMLCGAAVGLGVTVGRSPRAAADVVNGIIIDNSIAGIVVREVKTPSGARCVVVNNGYRGVGIACDFHPGVM